MVTFLFEGRASSKHGDLLMAIFLLVLGGLLTYNIVTGINVLLFLATLNPFWRRSALASFAQQG